MWPLLILFILLRTFGYSDLTILNYLSFLSLDIERTWWRLFHKRTRCANFDMYVFMNAQTWSKFIYYKRLILHNKGIGNHSSLLSFYLFFNQSFRPIDVHKKTKKQIIVNPLFYDSICMIDEMVKISTIKKSDSIKINRWKCHKVNKHFPYLYRYCEIFRYYYHTH